MMWRKDGEGELYLVGRSCDNADVSTYQKTNRPQRCATRRQSRFVAVIGVSASVEGLGSFREASGPPSDKISGSTPLVKTMADSIYGSMVNC
jgi:hypothetical protein